MIMDKNVRRDFKEHLDKRISLFNEREEHKRFNIQIVCKEYIPVTTENKKSVYGLYFTKTRADVETCYESLILASSSFRDLFSAMKGFEVGFRLGECY